MATAAQIHANQQNAQKSTGATSAAGKEASSQNRTTHGLSSSLHNNGTFYFLDDEDPEQYHAMRQRLIAEHKPQTETETILVRRLAQHEWLRIRALRLQRLCITTDHHTYATEHFALYLRYQTTHERAFYKALTELQKLRAERRKEQIGFESQMRAEAAEIRADKALNLRMQEFEIKKLRFERSAKSQQTASAPFPQADPSPGNQRMAA
jgi:hypothetical protein